MTKSRSASTKRTVKKKPLKKRAAAKRKVPKKAKKTTRSQSAGARRRPSTKTKTRTRARKKPGVRRPAKNATRSATASQARKRPSAAVKKPARRAASPRVARAPKPAAPPTPVVPANELKLGVVTHYYSHLSVAVVAITERRLHVGDRIHIKGHTSDFYQSVESIQIEHSSVPVAEIGHAVGVRVTEHAREHDVVYLVT